MPFARRTFIFAVAFLSQQSFALAALDPKQKAPILTYKMSLEEAIQVGIKNATSILKDNSAVSSAGANVMQAYGKFLPNLTATAGVQTYSGRYVLAAANLFRIYNVNTGLNYNLSSSVNVFNGFADESSLSAALARKEAALFSLERAKQQIAIDVTQSYLQVILDKKLEEIARGNLALTTEILGFMENQKRVGNATQIDIYRQRAQLAADKLLVSQASTKAQNDLLHLLGKLRFNVRNDCTLLDPKIELPGEGKKAPTADDLMAEALLQRRDLAASESLFRASQADIRYQRSGIFPKLDLNLSYGASSLLVKTLTVNDNKIITGYETQNQPTLLQQLPVQTQASVALNLTWNIFDRRQTEAKIQLAKISEYNSDLEMQDLQNQVRIDIKHALNDYNAALETIEAAKAGLESSQKVFSEVKARYEAGAANFIDLNSAQLALIQAKANWAQAVIGYRLKDDVVAFSVGKVTF